MQNLSLTERQKHILWATIRYYIATAEPVGSKVLADEFNLNVSPATIRNAMGVLEKAGLLYQPHTSAGRIPSDSGYRIYVDKLLQPIPDLGMQVEQLLHDKLNLSGGNLEVFLQRATQILANISGCIALITIPQNSTNYLRHLQLVQIDVNQIMIIIVTDNYTTQSVLMNLPHNSDETELDQETITQELQIISNFLSYELRGKSLTEIANLDWSQLGIQFQKYAANLQTVLTEFNQRNQTSKNTQIFIKGISEVLRQPEFSERQQVQMLIQLLEVEQDQLLPLILDQSGADLINTGQKKSRVTIRIGTENILAPMRTCTLISANYKQKEMSIGSVGILGPTRMVYENAIAFVEATADYLSEALS